MRTILSRLWYPVVLILLVCAAAVFVGDYFLNRIQNPPYAYAFQSPEGGSCNVAVVSLTGDFSTYGATVNVDDVINALQNADADGSIKGIVLQIDSPGGTPVAGEMLAHALQSLRKPAVALIREQGDSAAYWAATGAPEIIASPSSDVGSIGVTESYVSTAQQDQSQGKQFVQLSIGQFKDLGNPDKPLTDAERALIQRDLKIIYRHFVDAVAANRHLATSTVEGLADGSSMTGEMALQDHLVDQLGDADTARAWLEQKTGSKLTLCAAQ